MFNVYVTNKEILTLKQPPTQQTNHDQVFGTLLIMFTNGTFCVGLLKKEISQTLFSLTGFKSLPADTPNGF